MEGGGGGDGRAVWLRCPLVDQTHRAGLQNDALKRHLRPNCEGRTRHKSSQHMRSDHKEATRGDDPREYLQNGSIMAYVVKPELGLNLVASQPTLKHLDETNRYQACSRGASRTARHVCFGAHDLRLPAATTRCRSAALTNIPRVATPHSCKSEGPEAAAGSIRTDLRTNRRSNARLGRPVPDGQQAADEEIVDAIGASPSIHWRNSLTVV